MRIYAKRSKKFGPGCDELDGVVLGQRRHGDQILPVANGQLVWPFDQLRQPALVLGASGKGKTETTLRILYEVALKTDMPVFFLDAKGDEETAKRFVGLMKAAKRRRIRVFPHERFNGWEGDWKAIVNRLMQVIAYADFGPAAFYRDVAKTVLQAVCRAEDGPPRSSREFLERLSKTKLAEETGGTASVAVPDELVPQVRLRYEAFFGQVGTALDGDWEWGDADAAYFLLDSVGAEEDAASIASYLFADFGHYFKSRKPREQKCMLAVDEFSAISRRSDVAMRLEQARAFNAFLLLAPQTVSGMGSPEQQSRILGSVDMLICHGTKEPDRVAELAGVRQVPAITQRLEDRRHTGEAQIRMEDRSRLEPDRIRELHPGEAWVIRDNKAMKVAITKAPPTDPVDLPPAEETDAPIEKKAVDTSTSEVLNSAAKKAEANA